ncbi:hypothetical protein AX774_g3471 [Zancudomyces culisetae]|uniref:Uncharacterized protein n=1 Tax=Zancudomyces culisetae TaxID=1213189 RepID=A0A1R1PPW2_ZANCU|nr:hypothetical protein AX774_g3471 [Zancudomyces culisetae]|eukprot:OMH83026.1 hypothetical protein AX774_g3471 [Zancudomyces culisetae]
MISSLLLASLFSRKLPARTNTRVVLNKSSSARSLTPMLSRWLILCSASLLLTLPACSLMRSNNLRTSSVALVKLSMSGCPASVFLIIPLNSSGYRANRLVGRPRNDDNGNLRHSLFRSISLKNSLNPLFRFTSSSITYFDNGWLPPYSTYASNLSICRAIMSPIRKHTLLLLCRSTSSFCSTLLASYISSTFINTFLIVSLLRINRRFIIVSLNPFISISKSSTYSVSVYTSSYISSCRIISCWLILLNSAAVTVLLQYLPFVASRCFLLSPKHSQLFSPHK